jgi:uncharacterized protein (DUF983 family)
MKPIDRDHRRGRIWTAIGRALRNRCPSCGHGRFFSGYLSQVERCSICCEGFGQLRTGDGPAWLTVLIVGLLVIPLAVCVETNYQWPFAISMVVWPVAALVLTLGVLPRAKAVFLAVIWATRVPGF